MKGYGTYAVEVLAQLDGHTGWIEGGDIARAIGAPLANLKTAFQRLEGDSLIEARKLRRPTAYRLRTDLGDEGRAVINSLLKSREPPS